MNNEFCSWPIFSFVGGISLFFALLTTINIYENKGGNDQHKNTIGNVLFLLTVLPLYIMIAFTDSGVDYYSYYDQISLSSNGSYSKEEYFEPLFFFSAKYITSISNNVHFFLFTIKTATIFFFFYSLYLIKDKICFFFSVLAYLSVIYPGSFYIIRQSFTGSLLCYAFVLFAFKKKRIAPIVIMALATGFHYTAVFFLIAFILYLVINAESPQKAKTRSILTLFVTPFVIFVLYSQVSFFTYFSNAHYENYLIQEQAYEGSGMLQIVYYLPIFFSICLLIRDTNKSSLVLLFFIITDFCFIFAELGYIVPIFIRMRYFSSVVFSIIIPYVLHEFSSRPKSEHDSETALLRSSSPLALYMFFSCYFIFRIIVDIVPLLDFGNDSQLYWYHPMNPLF